MIRPSARPALIVLAFVAFVSLGLPDTLLGVAWPSIRETFGRPIDSLGLLLAFHVAGYLASSFFGGSLLRALGVGPLLAGSGALVTAAVTLYALSPIWPGLFLAAFLGGLGAGAIDAGVNAFGASAFSPRVMNWLHGFWGVGATLGPLVMTTAIHREIGWQAGYGVIGITMLALTTLFIATARMWRAQAGTSSSDDAPQPTGGLIEALRQRPVQGQALFFFLYAGVECGAGTWLYTLLHVSRGVDVAVAGTLVGGYWAAITVGRMVFGQVAASVSARAILRTGLFGALATITLLAGPLPVWVNGLGVLLLGFCLAPIFPTVISLTPARVGGRFAGHSVGFQVSAAAIGIALLPGLIGVIARRSSIEVLPWMLLAFAIPLALLNELLSPSRMTGGSAPRASAPPAG